MERVPTILRGLHNQDFWNRKDVPKAFHRTDLMKTPSSIQTLDIVIDFGIGDHMGDFDKSGFTFNGNKQLIWVSSGENGRKGSGSCSDERSPYIRVSRDMKLWLWQGWYGGNGSRRFLKMGNMTACLYAHGKDPEPERERLVIGAVLE